MENVKTKKLVEASCDLYGADNQPVAKIEFNSDARSHGLGFYEENAYVKEQALKLYQEAGQPYGEAVKASWNYIGTKPNPDFNIPKIFKKRGHWSCKKCEQETVVYSYEHKQYYCVDCDGEPTETKKGTKKNCFRCGGEYIEYTWFDPSGCPHCGWSFVD